MTKQDFIFSNRPSHRIARHVTFWLLFCFNFFVQSIYLSDIAEFSQLQTYKKAWTSVYCFVPVCIASAYTCLYFLLPYYLQKKRYAGCVVAFIILFAFDIFLNYFFSLLYHRNDFLENSNNFNFLDILSLGYLNSVWAIIISGFAMGIKLTKNWYQQQKENLEIVRKKTRSELQLQKTGLHPDFLFRSLNLINHQINTGSDNAAVLVLKLSDLLSYTLYKREIDLVPVEEELSALQNLILIEEKNDDSCFKIHLHIAFNDHDKFIAPMTILSLLYESLVMLKQGDSGYCIVTIRISSSFERLLVNFSFHLLSEIKSSPESWRVIIEASRRKLASSYNETDFQIQMAQNEQETLVVLNLPLINAIEAKPGMPDLKENRGIYEPA